MAEKKDYKAIQFPGVDAQREADIRKFLRTTGEFMDCTIEVVAVVALEVRVPADRGDVVTIVGKAAANEKKPRPSKPDATPEAS